MQERTEFVSREGILADIQEDIDFKSLTLTEDANNRMNDGLRLAQRRIRKYPAADVRPVVRGKWERPKGSTPRSWIFRCSVCGERAYFPVPKYFPKGCGYNFCPNCGAEMSDSQTLKDASQYADAGAMAPAT